MKDLEKPVLLSMITIPLMIGLRYFLGYRNILYVDIVLFGLMLICLGLFYVFKSKKTLFMRMIYTLFIMMLMSGLILPSFEFKGNHYDIIAGLSYSVPTLFCLLMIYVKRYVKFKK